MFHPTRDEYVAERTALYAKDAPELAEFDRSRHFPVLCRTTNAYLPCVTELCTECNMPISASEFIFGEVHLERHCGNSGFGFEPTHLKCWDAINARAEMEEHLWKFFQSAFDNGLFFDAVKTITGVRDAFKKANNLY